MITLRDYQTPLITGARMAFREGLTSVLLQLPTGGGKTLTAGYMLASAAQKGNVSWFIVNRVELLEQTVTAFDRLGIEAGIIASGFTPRPNARIQIASIDTLKRRLLKLSPPKIIVWDECRGLGAKGWTDVFQAFPNALHVGLDATPVRLDGTGLGKYFQRMVKGPSYSELQARGFLVPFDVYAPGGQLDMSGVHTVRGEFNQDEVEAMVDKPKLVGDVVDHYVRHAKGKLGITFAISRKHSEHLAESYRAAGIPAMHLDGDTDTREGKGTRKKIVEAFRRRELHVLTNVNLFSAGFDVPGVEVITDVAPSKSLAMFLQRAGRGSRPEPECGKERCMLLDHAGNVFRHGMPDEDREWTLEGREKGKKKSSDGEPDMPVRTCESCFAVYKPAPCCPNCGAASKLSPREVEHIEGELLKVSAAEIAARKKQDRIAVGRASTMEALEEIEKARGYKRGWAKHTFNSRNHSGSARAEAQAAAYLRGAA